MKYKREADRLENRLAFFSSLFYGLISCTVYGQDLIYELFMDLTWDFDIKLFLFCIWLLFFFVFCFY